MLTYDPIKLGSQPDDRKGDSALTAGGKINAMLRAAFNALLGIEPIQQPFIVPPITISAEGTGYLASLPFVIEGYREPGNPVKIRLTTSFGDGDYGGGVEFGQDADGDGIIVVNSGKTLGLGAGGPLPTLRLHPDSTLRPVVDNGFSFGSGVRRFAAIYLGTAPIVTSDAEEKLIRGDYQDAELDAWGVVQGRVFQYRDAIDAKGEAAARLHSGYVAQDVRDAFVAEGLDPSRYGLFCADPVDGGGERLGLRYEECAVIEAAWQRRELQRLTARVAALEG